MLLEGACLLFLNTMLRQVVCPEDPRNPARVCPHLYRIVQIFAPRSTRLQASPVSSADNTRNQSRIYARHSTWFRLEVMVPYCRLRSRAGNLVRFGCVLDLMRVSGTPSYRVGIDLPFTTRRSVIRRGAHVWCWMCKMLAARITKRFDICKARYWVGRILNVVRTYSNRRF